MSYNLTEDQQNIHDTTISQIKEAMKGDLFGENSYFSIHGPGGCGKTYLSKALITSLQNYSIAVLAPTHQALRVIKENVEEVNTSGNIIFGTVHSYLCLRPEIDKKTGQQKFKRGYKDKITKVDILIIDESSFISAELFTFIYEESQNNTFKCVLFLGDDRQLLPIKEDVEVPTIFDKKKFGFINHFGLSKVLRNGNLEVLDFYNAVRLMIDRKASKAELMDFLKEQKERTDLTKIHFVEDKKELLQKFLINNMEAIDASYKSGEDLCEDYILTFENAKVNVYNNTIRNFYFNHTGKNPDKIEVNDVLVAQDQYKVKENKYIQNSEKVIVKSVKPYVKSIQKHKLNALDCTVRSLFNGKEYKISILEDSSLDEFNKILNDNKRAKNWLEFYNAKGAFFDYKFPYSMTIHKAQGSTCRDSYIDCAGIDYVGSNDLLRLFYVAASRAQQNINILL